MTASPRPTVRSAFDDYVLISGAQADVTILARPGGVARVRVMIKGAASSTCEVFNGPVATGDRISWLDATSDGATDEVDVWCDETIHAKTVDSGGTIRVRISGHFR